jgi:hypothetical protein
MTDGSEESKSTINRVCSFVVVVLASERQATKAESESFHFRRDDGAVLGWRAMYHFQWNIRHKS